MANLRDFEPFWASPKTSKMAKILRMWEMAIFVILSHFRPTQMAKIRVFLATFADLGNHQLADFEPCCRATKMATITKLPIFVFGAIWASPKATHIAKIYGFLANFADSIYLNLPSGELLQSS